MEAASVGVVFKHSAYWLIFKTLGGSSRHTTVGKRITILRPEERVYPQVRGGQVDVKQNQCIHRFECQLFSLLREEINGFSFAVSTARKLLPPSLAKISHVPEK